MELMLIVGFIAQHLQGFIVVAIILGVILFIHGLVHAGDAEKRQQAMDYLEASDKLLNATESRSIDRVKKSIASLDYEYSKVKDITGESGYHLYSEDRSFLTEHLHDLEQEKWEKEADKHLLEFLDCYLTVISGELEHFNELEKLLSIKKRCIDQWREYYSIDLSEYEITINPKRYMREWMGEDYDPCMESLDALEKKLSGYPGRQL